MILQVETSTENSIFIKFSAIVLCVQKGKKGMKSGWDGNGVNTEWDVEKATLQTKARQEKLNSS